MDFANGTAAGIKNVDKTNTDVLTRCVAGILPKIFRSNFTDNEDGTVLDSRTGLVWQQCPEGRSLPNCTGLNDSRTWENSIAYCNSLTLVGRNWRLPNVNEWNSLVDMSRNGTKIDTDAFPGVQANDFPFWSSTTNDVSGTRNRAWKIIFSNFGSLDVASTKNSSYPVRCVSGP